MINFAIWLVFWMFVAYVFKFIIDGYVEGFKSFNKPKVGQIWYRYSEYNKPWDEKEMVQIAEIKQGWLKYDISPPNLYLMTCKISDFRRRYRLVRTTEEKPVK